MVNMMEGKIGVRFHYSPDKEMMVASTEIGKRR
jgi:hypothetical protein